MLLTGNTALTVWRRHAFAPPLCAQLSRQSNPPGESGEDPWNLHVPFGTDRSSARSSCGTRWESDAFAAWLQPGSRRRPCCFTRSRNNARIGHSTFDSQRGAADGRVDASECWESGGRTGEWEAGVKVEMRVSWCRMCASEDPQRTLMKSLW